MSNTPTFQTHDISSMCGKRVISKMSMANLEKILNSNKGQPFYFDFKGFKAYEIHWYSSFRGINYFKEAEIRNAYFSLKKKREMKYGIKFNNLFSMPDESPFKAFLYTCTEKQYMSFYEQLKEKFKRETRKVIKVSRKQLADCCGVTCSTFISALNQKEADLEEYLDMFAETLRKTFLEGCLKKYNRGPLGVFTALPTVFYEKFKDSVFSSEYDTNKYAKLEHLLTSEDGKYMLFWSNLAKDPDFIANYFNGPYKLSPEYKKKLSKDTLEINTYGGSCVEKSLVKVAYSFEDRCEDYSIPPSTVREPPFLLSVLADSPLQHNQIEYHAFDMLRRGFQMLPEQPLFPNGNYQNTIDIDECYCDELEHGDVCEECEGGGRPHWLLPLFCNNPLYNVKGK